MNRIFRIIWSQALNTWVVVSELATRRGKRSSGGEVDARIAPSALTLDRDMVESSPPDTAWALRLGIALALLPRRAISGLSLSMRPLSMGTLSIGSAPMSTILAAALLGSAIAPAHATDYYWDINDSTAGAGGTTPSGTWSSTDLTLTTDINGNLVVVPHTTTTADRIFFSAGGDATGAYTVNVSGTQNINRLTFQEGNVLLTGGIINFGGTAPQITADTTQDTIASTITGAFTLANALSFGGGLSTSLRLTGTNTYTGTAKVGTNLILAAPGGNALTGDIVMGDVNLSTSGGSITLNAANQISDTAKLSLLATPNTGSHLFALNGFNETIGGLELRNDAVVATATVRNGAATDATLTLAGSGVYNGGFGTNLTNSKITDGGAGKLNLVIAMTGTGRQNIYGATANFTGTTTITSGTLLLQNTSTWASNITLNGGSLTLSQQTAAGSGFAGAAVRTHANTIGGTGGTLSKTQDGTVILSGINTYQGGTRVLAGTLQAGSTSAFGIDSAVTISTGANLNLNGFNNSIGSLAHVSGLTGGNVQLGSATLTTGSKNTSTGYGGVISGSGNLVKVGTGTQSLAGTNTYTGTTTINGGTLQVGFVAPFGFADGLTGTLGTGAVSLGAAGTLAFGRANAHTVANTITGAGTLAQVGTGITTLTANNSVGATTISAGTLDINGVLTTGPVTMGNGTLNVDGTVQASGATQTVLGNTAGTASTVSIGSGGTLLATGDLGDGNDTLDVTGTLNTGAGSFLLGDGDDNFVIHDGTNVIGTVVGGAGVDTYIYDIAGTANVGALSEFEGLTKRGAGTVNLTGPGTTDLANVRVEQGTLNVQAGASVVAQGTGNLDTLVAAGATFNVDGSYTASTNADTFDVSGTVSGAGTIDLNDGDDTLVLHDGADLGGLTNPIDGGAGLADTINADIATSATLGGVVNFETLTKTSGGTLSVVGPTAFTTVDVLGGTLDVDATGSINDVNNATVATGATLNVDGGFGFTAGADSFTVAGNVTGLGSVDMLDGDDLLTIQDGADLSGLTSAIDGGAGAGTDTLMADIAGSAILGGAINFETLIKSNVGTLDINGPASSQFDTVLVQGGTLHVSAAAIVDPQTTVVASGATMTVDGTYNGTTGQDTFTVSGTVDGTGTIDLLGDDDTLTLNDGADISGLANPLDGGAHTAGDTVVLNNSGALTFNGDNVVNFESLLKTDIGTATLIGTSTFSSGTTLWAGTLDVDGTLNTSGVTLGDDATLNVDGTVQDTGATQTSITGSTGSNTVSVGTGGTLLATGDLGDGDDVLDAAGTLNTGTGSLLLGDGDDTFTIHDNTVMQGVVDAGNGLDTFNTDIAVIADLGAVNGFEALDKSGLGTLNVNGPAVSDFGTVTVSEGTLNVTAGGSIAAAPGNTLDTVVLGGATLNVEGSYGCGADSDLMSVFGTVSGSGNIDLCDGDDTLILNDGAVLTNAISGGTGTGDTLVLNSVTALTVDAGNTTNFEFLTKTKAGTATLTGTQSFTGGTTIDGGTLDVDGALKTPTVTLADGTTLNVDGSVQAVGGTAAAISGSAGANAVTVGAGGTLLATGDLGDGNDVLDVAGTLDTGGGTLALGDGDDTFTVHDGTNVIGTVDGGAGLDTRIYDINLTANLGALVNFEGLTKTGTGTLNINGPGATDLQQVSVLRGMLNVGAGASVAATSGSSLDTVVASGATLNVDGSYGCGANNDTMSVSGTVSGSGIIDLCGGDDTLTINDGAVLNNVIDGGANGAGDTVVLNNANAFTFDAGNTINFEILQKDNTGTATLTGTQSFSGGTTINGGTLDVDGTLETPTVAMGDGTTFNVDGVMQGTGGTAATITGSAGVNTVTVAGTLLASGDMGAGNDTLDVLGTLNTGAGVFNLGDGDDTLTIHDGTNIIGTVAAGAGNDTFNTDITTVADLGAVQGFETLSKSGIGALNINGLLSSDFTTVNVLAGTLHVTAGGSVIAQNTTVAAGSTLQVDGSYTGTTGNDTFTVAGTVAGTSNLDLLDGDDTFTIQDGADLSGLANAVDGGAGTDTFTADLAGSATLGGAINFETLTKTNTGTLHINGLAPSAFTTVNVDGGMLDVGVGGTVDGVVTTTVANGATLNVDGSYTGSSGNDAVTVAGIVAGTGTVGLGDGNDTLTLQDGADLAGLINALDGGAGTDTVAAQVAGTMTLGPTVNFETLQKSGAGALTLVGNQAFDTAQIDAGTATIAAGATLTSQNTTVAAGATLDVQGTFTGTAGDDSFTSRGNVIGALGFADGNDTVAFIGGDLSGLTGVGGGAGGSDRLSFSGLSFDGGDFAMTGWERAELLNDSTLTLSSALALGGMLAIDATSQLDANTGASIGGSVENAGLINLGANRLAISGGYQANNGALQLLVSPGGANSGGLDIAGDVTGNTLVTFASDGTDVPLQQDASILVISSANDNLATVGGFSAADAINGYVRLTGSISPWDFAQHADKSWYLDAVAGILPETAGYAVMPSIGQANIQDNNRLLFQRMDAVRGDTPHCNADGKQAHMSLAGQCQGFWMAVTGSELEMGANPGFEFSGDSVGAYVGVDGLLQDRGTRTFRGGFFAGFQRGNYWTTGVNSTDLPGTGESNVRIDTPTFGMYGSFNWHGGSYADVSLVAQLPQATIAVADGFHQEISGNTLTLSTQMGHRFQLGIGWTVEPQVQLSASAMQWGGGQVDASGKQLVLDDDVLGTARASVHAEKVFETAGGARVRPWATLGLQDTVGEKQQAFSVVLPGAGAGTQPFPNHELGLTATLDVGVEAELNKSVSLFGVLSYGESLQGSDSEQRQANLGVRIRW